MGRVGGDAERGGDQGNVDDGEHLIVPFGGLNQVWGTLIAARSDDPAEMRRIRTQRRLVAALMILTTLVSLVVVVLLVYPR
jgi:hypothetical protein